MHGKNEGVESTGLRYFGSMSASIAHEIKNYLAIGNENAGLMKDLSLMRIKDGQSLDPERMAKLSENVMKQIARTDTIIKKMSRFAHSVDNPVKSINLMEVLELTLDLGRRSAQAFGAELAPVQCETDIFIQTNPFMFMNLFWLLMESASKREKGNKKIEVSVSNEQGVVKIYIMTTMPQLPEQSTVEATTNSNDQVSVDQNQKETVSLADFLDMNLEYKGEEIILTVPEKHGVI